MCLKAGIQGTLDNSAAHLKGWLGALRGDARLIVAAASAAQRAADFVLARDCPETVEEPATSG